MNPGNNEALDVKAAMHALNTEARYASQAHPSVDQLFAYHERTLADGEAERVRDHLAVCEECTRTVLDIAAFGEPAPAACPEEASEEWDAVRGVLVAEGHLEPRHPGRVAGSPWSSRRFTYFLGTMAAVFGAISLMLGLQLIAAHETISQLDQPETNVRLVDLMPEGSANQRDEGSPRFVTAGGDADESFVFLLNVVDPESYPEYRVEILEQREPGNAPVWTLDAMTWNLLDGFTIKLSRRQLPGEEYELRLYGVAGSKKELLQTFHIRFVTP